MHTANWKQMFLLGLILASAGAATLPSNVLGVPTSSLGLFGFGLVLILAGLVRRRQA